MADTFLEVVVGSCSEAPALPPSATPLARPPPHGPVKDEPRRGEGRLPPLLFQPRAQGGGAPGDFAFPNWLSKSINRYEST